MKYEEKPCVLLGRQEFCVIMGGKEGKEIEKRSSSCKEIEDSLDLIIDLRR